VEPSVRLNSPGPGDTAGYHPVNVTSYIGRGRTDRRVLGRSVGFDSGEFSGGKVGFNRAEFTGAEVDCGKVGFNRAEFTGAEVDFRGEYADNAAAARFSGGEVDFSYPGDWSFPPAIPLDRYPAPGRDAPHRGRPIQA
jgi:hypothetical protein